MKRLAGVFFVVLAVVLGAQANAAGAENDWYAGARIGVSVANDTGFSGQGLDIVTDWKTAPAAGVFVGRQHGQFRSEFEYVARRSGLSSITAVQDGGLGAAWGVGALAGQLSPVDGALKVQNFFVNLYRDFQTDGAISPYVGAGIGLALLKFDNLGGGGAMIANGKDSRLGYQGIAGIRYKVAGNVDLTFDYRFVGATASEFANPLGDRIRGRYKSHNLMAGLLYRFGEPPARPLEPALYQVPAPAPELAPRPAPEPEFMPQPEPEPAPPPEPEPVVPGPFLVFFDWDRADIRPGAARIIAQAAAAARETGQAVIDTTGHADRSGPESYNMGLSVRRAEAVRAELIGLGIGAEAITVRGLGETTPLVPTPDGVREPQNRRVEIVFPESD